MSLQNLSKTCPIDIYDARYKACEQNIISKKYNLVTVSGIFFTVWLVLLFLIYRLRNKILHYEKKINGKPLKTFI